MRTATAAALAALLLTAGCAAPALVARAPAAPGPASTPLSRTGGDAHRLASPVPPAAVPILMYHYIRVAPAGDQLGFGLSVTPDDFQQQMDWLRDHGFHPVHMSEVRAYFEHGDPLPAKPVVLSFDDGYQDFYAAALPVLLAHGFLAEAYVVPGFLGHPGYLSPDQVKSLPGQGVEVGAHTMSHADLTTIHGDQLRSEVAGSGAFLGNLLGRPVLDFCYPSGKFDQEVVDEVTRAGFQTAVTTQPGGVLDWGSRYSWGRVRVSGGESLADFARALGS